MLTAISLLLVFVTQKEKILSLLSISEIKQRIKIILFFWASVFLILVFFNKTIFYNFWKPILDLGLKVSTTKLEYKFWLEAKIIFQLSVWLILPLIFNFILFCFYKVNPRGNSVGIIRLNRANFFFVLFWAAISVSAYYGLNTFDEYVNTHSKETNPNIIWRPDLNECLNWYSRLAITHIILAAIPFLTFLLQKLKFQDLRLIISGIVLLVMFDYFNFEYEFVKYSFMAISEIYVFSWIFSSTLKIWEQIQYKKQVIKLQKNAKLSREIK
jgi:hypothetical protein